MAASSEPWAVPSAVVGTTVDTDTHGTHDYGISAMLLPPHALDEVDGVPSDQPPSAASSAAPSATSLVEHALAPPRRVGTAGLLALGFFWVSGGIFGNEALMQAAPPAHVFGSLVLASVFYALPISLMTGELAAALPYNGGMVAWVTEACGPMIGAQNMWWIWVSTLLDSAIYPVLAAHYLAKRMDLGALSVGGSSTTESTTRLIANMFIALVTLVKLGGTDCMVRSTKVLACVATVPVLIFIMAGVSKIDLPAVTSTDASDDAGGSDFALLTSWVLWLYSGFFFLGSLAGEVKDPQRVYPIVALTLVPVVTLLCIAPLAVAVSIDPNRTHYVAGHFDTVATSLVGDWLGVCFIIAACVSQIGLFNGDMVVAERSLASFFDGHLLQVGGDRRWWLTRFFVEENGTGVAPIYIVFNAGVAACLTWFSYQDLVEFQMMQFALCSLLFLYAFCWYKWRMPELCRPFAVPGKVVGSILIALPVAAITVVNMWFSATDPTPLLGIAYAKAVVFTALTGTGLLIHLVLHICHYRGRRFSKGGSIQYSLVVAGPADTQP